MTILAILGVLDEAELLPNAIEHLRAIGVDRIVVLDAGSTDGSLEYLETAEAAGDIWTIHVSQDDPDDRTQRIKSELARDSGADWVVVLDADEFLVPATGSLLDLPDLSSADTLSVFRYNVVLGTDGPMLPARLDVRANHELMLYARPSAWFPEAEPLPERPWISGLLEPKVLARPEVLGTFGPGDHEIQTDGSRRWRQRTTTDLLIAHVPFSTRDRFERKARNASLAIARNPEWFEDGQGWQWVGWARQYEAGLAADEFERQAIDAERYDELRRTGVVRSAAELFAEPTAGPGLEQPDSVERAQPWLILAGQVCAAEGIPVERKLEPTFPSTYPTVLAPPHHVIKLFSGRDDGHGVAKREATALQRAGRDRSLPVPRLVSTGSLDAEWRYVVMSRLPGRNLTFMLEDLGPPEVAEAARWLGDFASRLHAVALTDEETTDSEAGFRALVERRRAEAPTRLADRRGLPPHLLEEVAAWLPSSAELLHSPRAPVLLHGGLQDDHVLATDRNDPRGLRPTAVIDFGDSLIGHPYFELGPAWWTWLNADRSYIDAFIDALALPGRSDPGFPRLALAWSLIRCAWNPRLPAYLAAAHDLDELADLSFGRTTC